jgi:transcription antitermination factor NusG
MADNKRWYVASVAPDASAHLVEWLKALGYGVHEFMHERKRRKKNPYKVPSFPGYLFVEFDLLEMTWVQILSLSGFLKFLSADGAYPTPLRVGVFEAFKESHDKFFELPVSKTQAEKIVAEHIVPIGKIVTLKPITKGTAVKIPDGPFQDHIGHVVDDSYGNTVDIEINIFGRQTKVTIPRSKIPETVS